jgi:hypothetical protein
VGAEAKGLRTELTIDIKLHAKQGNILASPATEILYGGAAGGGKSHLMRALAILWAYSFPGLQVYMFRRISDDLTKNHVEGPKGFRALLADWVSAGSVEIVETEIRFKFNGSKIYLCHCHEDKDRFKYQGAEIHVLLMDELTHFTEVVYRYLRSSVRMVGMKDCPGRAPRPLPPHHRRLQPGQRRPRMGEESLHRRPRAAMRCGAPRTRRAECCASTCPPSSPTTPRWPRTTRPTAPSCAVSALPSS